MTNIPAKLIPYESSYQQKTHIIDLIHRSHNIQSKINSRTIDTKLLPDGNIEYSISEGGIGKSSISFGSLSNQSSISSTGNFSKEKLNFEIESSYSMGSLDYKKGIIFRDGSGIELSGSADIASLNLSIGNSCNLKLDAKIFENAIEINARTGKNCMINLDGSIEYSTQYEIEASGRLGIGAEIDSKNIISSIKKITVGINGSLSVSYNNENTYNFDKGFFSKKDILACKIDAYYNKIEYLESIKLRQPHGILDDDIVKEIKYLKTQLLNDSEIQNTVNKSIETLRNSINKI